MKFMDTIAELNDTFRRTFDGGIVNVTRYVNNLPRETYLELLRQIQNYTEFDEHNDPYGEHDLGVVFLAGEPFIWKIDYYDEDCKYHSRDPSNPVITTRVLTIMARDEY